MSPNQLSILVVEDEPLAQKRLMAHLQKQGYFCLGASTAHEALNLLQQQLFEIVLLDIQLPDCEDFSLTKKIRSIHSCGIIIITGLVDRSHRLQGLKAGADDYLVKPYDMQELLLKVNNLAIRISKNYQLQDPVIQSIAFSDWLYLPVNQTLSNAKGAEFQLTKAEHEVLMIFLNNPKRIISRDEILALLSDDGVFDRAIDSRVSRLKKKIASLNPKQALIQSVYGSGYIFNSEVAIRRSH